MCVSETGNAPGRSLPRNTSCSASTIPTGGGVVDLPLLLLQLLLLLYFLLLWSLPLRGRLGPYTVPSEGVERAARSSPGAVTIVTTAGLFDDVRSGMGNNAGLERSGVRDVGGGGGCRGGRELGFGCGSCWGSLEGPGCCRRGGSGDGRPPHRSCIHRGIGFAGLGLKAGSLMGSRIET